jgi:hypothetical protein
MVISWFLDWLILPKLQSVIFYRMSVPFFNFCRWKPVTTVCTEIAALSLEAVIWSADFCVIWLLVTSVTFLHINYNNLFTTVCMWYPRYYCSHRHKHKRILWGTHSSEIWCHATGCFAHYFLSPKTLGTNCPVTWHHISEEQTPQVHHCKNPESSQTCIILVLPPSALPALTPYALIACTGTLPLLLLYHQPYIIQKIPLPVYVKLQFVLI